MKPKIAWASVGETFYSHVPAEYILLDTNYFFATKNADFFVKFLNSKLIIFWINTEDTAIGSGGAYRHYKYNLERLYIPNITALIKIQSLQYEQVDKCLYDYYSLTPEEIDFIETSVIQ